MSPTQPVKRKQLAIQLERVKSFDSPDERLEQYKLDSEAAADILWMMKNDNTEFSNSRVLDLGCGTGVLAIGAAILGVRFAVGVDLDQAALQTARNSARELGVDAQTDWVQARVPEVSLRADIVVQNPPFGVKRKGSDRVFLETALQSGSVVYSIHLSSESSREFLQRFIEQHHARLSAIIPIIVKIRHTLPQHRERLHEVKAEIYKITK